MGAKMAAETLYGQPDINGKKARCSWIVIGKPQ